MKLTVRGLKGDLHSFYIHDRQTVGELKAQLERPEGFPKEQMVMVHAGEELLDHIPLEDYQMEEFNLSQEAFLHLSRRPPAITHIYLSPAGAPAQLMCETVENDATVDSVMELIVTRGLATEMRRDGKIVVMRQEGKVIQVNISREDLVPEVIMKVEALKIPVKYLTFRPASDGNLHIVVAPLPELQTECYPVYSRSVQKQPVMLVAEHKGMGLNELAKELCIMSGVEGA